MLHTNSTTLEFKSLLVLTYTFASTWTFIKMLKC